MEEIDALSNETRTRERRRRLVNEPGARCLVGMDEDESMGFEKEDRQAWRMALILVLLRCGRRGIDR